MTQPIRIIFNTRRAAYVLTTLVGLLQVAPVAAQSPAAVCGKIALPKPKLPA